MPTKATAAVHVATIARYVHNRSRETAPSCYR
jgi:hypothetical protein